MRLLRNALITRYLDHPELIRNFGYKSHRHESNSISFVTSSLPQKTTMKIFVFACIVGFVAASKLDNTYLPPLNARTAGGNNFLSVPFERRTQPSAVYGAPTGSHTRPIYDAPNNDRTSYEAPMYAPTDNTYTRNSAQASYHSAPIHILRSNNQNNGDGTYQFDYETENKITQHETGQLKNAGGNEESSVVHGSYSYASPDGQTITLEYVADENGFQPTGQHLPTPPPIPEAILKSLELNAAEEAAARNGQSTFNGQYQAQHGHYQTGQVSRQYLTPNVADNGYRY